MRYKFCGFRINVTNYGVTFATKGPPPSPWLSHWSE